MKEAKPASAVNCVIALFDSQHNPTVCACVRLVICLHVRGRMRITNTQTSAHAL